MKADIVRFIRSIAPKYKLGAIYYPETDTYALDRKGRAVQNFTSKTFYEIPKLGRTRMFAPLIRVGMNQNLGEKIKEQVLINRKHGIKII